MPELPEVETVLQGLKPIMKGFKINKVVQNRLDLRYPFPENFVERLTGRLITDISRRAKYMIADLDSGESLIIHLGMSGRVSVTKDYHPKKHDHAIFHMSSGAIVTYNDARRFGFIDLCTTDHLASYKAFKTLGPEPLSEQFTLDFLLAVAKNKSAPIKSVLLDQRIVAGLGNIYVCEALYLSRIHPSRPACEINRPEMAQLLKSIQGVLKKAIAAGGSTLRDHQQTNGEMGYFQHSFQVYGRQGETCNRCGAPIWRMQHAGRSSFYCSSCQV